MAFIPVMSARDAIDDGMANPRGQMTFIVNVVLTVLASFLVGCRFYARITIFHVIGSDDWTILAVVPISITMTAMFYAEAKYGFGLHIDDISKAHYLQASKYLLACQVPYKTGVAIAKMSMLLLYLRIFQTNGFRRAVYVVMFLVVGAAIGTILPTIFQCNPIQKAWTPSLKGHCLYQPPVWYAASSLAILTDVLIIILPMSQLPKLKLARAQKIALGFLFSIGIFIFMTTVIRLTTLGPSATSRYKSYYQATSNLWLGVEVNVSIICTCLPPLKAPIAKTFPRLFSGLSNSSNDRSKEISRSRASKTNRASGLPPNPISSNYFARPHISSATGARKGGASDSDEEIMLQGITKKSNVEITYEEHHPGNPFGG